MLYQLLPTTSFTATISTDLGKDYPRIQILTIEELLKGAEIKMPQQALATFKQAPRIKETASQGELGLI